MNQPQDAPAELELRLAEETDAEALLAIVHAAFGARKPLDPPADALSDTIADVQQRLATGAAVICSDEGADIGCLFVSFDHTAEVPTPMLHRVSVRPGSRQHGAAHVMVVAAAGLALDAGMRRLQLVARRELPEVVAYWQGHGFVVAGELDPHRLLLRTELPARVAVPTADAMRSLGRRLAGLLRPGDVIVASGELGAGKTTLAQGLGEGLQVTGPVTSPTFVLSRIHPASITGPALVHVDAYRLASAAELEDLDLDISLAESVTLVEWGAGLVEGLAEERLEIDIERSEAVDDETRMVSLRGVGPRWREVDLWAFAEQEDA